jgi:hypothetical protein
VLGNVLTFVVPLQVPGPQTVPTAYLRHPPVPLQMPLVLHREGPRSLHRLRGSVAPALVKVQMPGMSAAQERQPPVQAVLQQTPSSQKPLLHSPPVPQVWPCPLSPHVLVV